MLKKALLLFSLSLIAILCLFFYSYSGAISEVSTDQRVLALTYDDGPNSPDTESLLALLEAKGVKVTYFPKGRNVEHWPQLLRRVHEAGHELGNHSYTHKNMSLMSSREVALELDKSNALISAVTGSEVRLFRPPYGLQGPFLSAGLKARGMTSILFSAAGFDWELDTPEAVAEKVLADVKPGAIVLLHDGRGDVDSPQAQAPREHSVAATALIIDRLRADGYRFVTVGELLALGSD